MPDSALMLFIALSVIVPGFIIKSIASLFTTRRLDISAGNWIDTFSIGAVNFAIWSWLVYLLLTAKFFQENLAGAALGWGVVCLLGPVGIGLLSGYNTQKGWTRRLLQAIGLQPVHAIPTAWDGRFREMNEPHWMLITLQDGSEVAGLFGTRSWASSDPNERDLYIEKLFEIDNNGNWLKANSYKGMLIRPEEVRFIEIWPTTEGGET